MVEKVCRERHGKDKWRRKGGHYRDGNEQNCIRKKTKRKGQRQRRSDEF